MKIKALNQSGFAKLTLAAAAFVAIVGVAAGFYFSPKLKGSLTRGLGKRPTAQPMFIVQFPLGLKEERLKTLPAFKKCEPGHAKGDEQTYKCAAVSPLFKQIEVTTKFGVVARVEAFMGEQEKLVEGYGTRASTILGTPETSGPANCKELSPMVHSQYGLSCSKGGLVYTQWNSRGNKVSLYNQKGDKGETLVAVVTERPVTAPPPAVRAAGTLPVPGQKPGITPPTGNRTPTSAHSTAKPGTAVKATPAKAAVKH
ncbi:hypothetical protein K2X33_12140 [bacterium]|nr:hypothetical protein [bacterium]